MHSELEKWVRSRILQSTKPPTDIVLLVDIQPAPATLDTFALDPGADYETQLQVCLGQFDDSLAAHVAEQSRATKYILELRDGLRVLASRPFRLASTANAVAVGETEPPNGAGALALGMRMTESMHRTVMMQVAALNDKMAQMLTSMVDRVSVLEQRHIQMLEERASFMAENAETRLELVKEEAKQARYDKVVAQLAPAIGVIVPDVLKKLTAGDKSESLTVSKSGSESEDGFKHGMLDLFKSLTEEQQATLVKTLTPEQAAKLMALISEEQDA